MKNILNEIRCCLDNHLYFIALQSTLSLPDICAALQSPNGKTKSSKYINWYNKYVGNINIIDGSECYELRCSIIHQGNTQNTNLGYSRIIFVEPGHGFTMHNNIINDALNIDINIFCLTMIECVEKWMSIVKDDPIYQNNYEKLFKRYPNGIAPYIVGIPVIS